MKYIMSKGTFKCKENDEVVNAISGKLVGIRIVTPEDGAETLQIDLSDDSGEEPVVKTLSLKKYGDASLKVLRCLFGIAEIIRDKVITFSLEEREGRSALITVTADDEILTPCGTVEPYAYDKKLLTDKILVVLKRCFDFKKVIVIYANADGIYPAAYEGDFDAEAAASYIRDLRRAGRGAEITLKKTTFTSVAAANGYLKALEDLKGTGSFRVITDEEDTEILWAAYTEELTSNIAPAEEEIDERGRVVEG